MRPVLTALLAATIALVACGGAAAVPPASTTAATVATATAGVYSDVDSARGQKFLRGYQNTDASGSAKFTTVYPGWYQGRAVHIHFKIRPTSSTEFTSQLFFDDALSTQVFAQSPYSQKGTQGITRNSSDGIYQQSGGKLLLNVTKTGDTCAATFDIGLAS